MQPGHQLKITDLYSIPIGNVKKLVPHFFDKEKYVIPYKILKVYLRLELKLKKMHHVLEFRHSQWLKAQVELNTQKRIEVEKKNGQKQRRKSVEQFNK